jgi:hypothetical protein
MIWVLVAVLVVAGLVALAPRLLRDQRLDDVERFHRARAMTTEWARAGVTQPVFADEAAREFADADAERR